MADAVYLHIGAPKTGTSYLQKTLWGNRKILPEQGIFVPLQRPARMHFDAVADLRGGMWADGPLTATWDELAADVKARPGVAVISEELLCGTPTEQIERIIESMAPTPVHVIHAARDLGRQIPAEWQQSLRARSAMPYDEWLGRLSESDRPFWSMQDPTVVFERWKDHLEPGHFHVLCVPSKGAPHDLLWQRFCSIFGADPARADLPEGMENASLGLVESELLRRLNGQLGDSFPMRNPYIKVLREHFTLPGLHGAPDPQRIGVPEQFHEWITSRSQQMVDDLRAIGDQVDIVGDPDDLLAQIEPATRAPGEISDGELLDAALAAITRQLHRIEEREANRGREMRRLRARERELMAEADSRLPRRVRRKLGSVKRRVLPRR